jgi:hypothetical protein
MQVDADDYLAPDALTKLAKIVDDNPDVDVVGLIDGAMTYNGSITTGNAFFNSADIYKFANVKGSHGLRLIELGKFLAANLLQNRMLLYSKKVVNSFDFDESFLGSEDVVASYKLYYNPDINYVLTEEHLYVYDLEDSGNFYAFLSNPIEIKKVLRELKVVVNESRIQN